MDTNMCGLILAGAFWTQFPYHRTSSHPEQLRSIDKTSSAELSEAINSMYKWYAEADICYAYLSDIRTVSSPSQPSWSIATFATSKWFTRGWTLQELIAPRSVEFYAEDWTDLGTKSSRRDEISTITGIDVRVLDGENPAICNVAERLSWAASRQTTRSEDAAYCLLGIFQVHMPLLYGEGDRALIRLQEEILKTTEDYTLLARNAGSLLDTHPKYGLPGALARRLSEFNITKRPGKKSWSYSDLVTVSHAISLPLKSVVTDVTPTLTARGLHICLPVLKTSSDEYYAYLYCRLQITDELICIPLSQAHPGEKRFTRRLGFIDGDPIAIPSTRLTSFQPLTMFIQQTPPEPPRSNIQNRHFSTFTFDATAPVGLDTIASLKCKVMTSWGSRTSALPWRTRVEAEPDSLEFHLSTLQQSALFALGPGNDFMVVFGSKSSKLWCCVLLGDESPQNLVKREDSHDWNSWKGYQNFVPSVLVDRVSKRLRVDGRVVNVSIRKVLSRLAVSVRINEPRHVETPQVVIELDV